MSVLLNTEVLLGLKSEPSSFFITHLIRRLR